VNFIRVYALNYYEFVALLEKAENKCGEIIHHTKVRWLRHGFILK
jgi:hypothetical protein